MAEVLPMALQDAHSLIRDKAMQLVPNIFGEDAVPYLIQGLEDAGEHVRRTAALGLREVVADPQSAVPAFRSSSIGHGLASECAPDDEVRRLLEVASPRESVNLTAINTGLRRAKLAALGKGDCDLHGDNRCRTPRCQARWRQSPERDTAR